MERAATALPLRHPAMLLATWFGSGLLPKAPGTWGSLAAIPFAFVIAQAFGSLALIPAALGIFLVGWWASNRVSEASGIKDPGMIVIDEVAGQWLTLAAAPPGWIAWGLGFLLFRAADIVKPWPANWADRAAPGGLGVMLDDLLAAVYSGLALWAIHHWVLSHG